ncbi:hypothetical protein PCE1_002757 [Barthelona sp. PCE]
MVSDSHEHVASEGYTFASNVYSNVIQMLAVFLVVLMGNLFLRWYVSIPLAMFFVGLSFKSKYRLISVAASFGCITAVGMGPQLLSYICSAAIYTIIVLTSIVVGYIRGDRTMMRKLAYTAAAVISLTLMTYTILYFVSFFRIRMMFNRYYLLTLVGELAFFIIVLDEIESKSYMTVDEASLELFYSVVKVFMQILRLILANQSQKQKEKDKDE